MRSALRKRWFALWPITAGLILYPVNNLPLRLSVLAAVMALYFGLLYFWWSNRTIRFTALTFIFLIGLFVLLPAKKFNASALRKNYVTSLLSYEGTRYIWGGENQWGIDCSGLIRSGLINANYHQGFLTLNPGLIRESLDLWWHDCSARALGEGHRQRTRELFSSKSINEIDHSKILPGDIAVTEDGTHVLAYIGGQTWIEADPEVKRVVKVHVPASNAWFQESVRVMRWGELE
ncbi:MAG: cell wall-associated hydrolase, invasion-associated protein [Pedosphaera sp.]|nr:cell wall-associated hydrolase, invasion-associated protein [Pedosphaera sp.]